MTTTPWRLADRRGQRRDRQAESSVTQLDVSRSRSKYSRGVCRRHSRLIEDYLSVLRLDNGLGGKASLALNPISVEV